MRELYSMEAEQSVIGALLRDNAAIDRISALTAEQFFRHDHKMIYAEILSQVTANKSADPITIAERLGARVEDGMQYLITLAGNAVSAANIKKHAEIIVDRAMLRSLQIFANDVQEMIKSSPDAAMSIYGTVAQKLDSIGQFKDDSNPVLARELLASYSEVLTDRMEGRVKLVPTGFRDLDEMLDGGLEPGTLTVIAGRPAMGKTAKGLNLARNVSFDGAACFFSMEMTAGQVVDRNVAALGKVPLSWLKKPTEHAGSDFNWDGVTHAFKQHNDMNLWVDDSTNLSMVEIRAKARYVKRLHGSLSLVVIDQLSFIEGAGKEENKSYEIGTITRACVALAKELDCAVVLLCQLNRKCEDRPNKRPVMADLAVSGSIEQDAACILFLYRDIVYNLQSDDPETCEIILAKNRQGATGTVGLRYIGPQVRFEDWPHRWQPRERKIEVPRRRSGGLD